MSKKSFPEALKLNFWDEVGVINPKLPKLNAF